MAHVPPILRGVKGLVVNEVGTTDHGYPFIRLVAPRSKRIRSVIVYIVGDQPGKFMYGYTYIDPDTNVLISKHGPYGDPEQDEDGEWLALPPEGES